MAFYVASYFLAEHAVKLHQALGLSEQSVNKTQLIKVLGVNKAQC